MPVPPYPAVPAPATYLDGQALHARDLRNDVTNAVDFLANRPLFTGYNTAGTSIGNATWSPLPIPSEIADTWGGHDPLGTNPERYYCQAPGWYLCMAFSSWPYTSTTANRFAVGLSASQGGTTTMLAGDNWQWSSGQNPASLTCDLIKLTSAGPPGSATADWVSAEVYQGTGASLGLLTTGGHAPWFSARWVAAASGTAGLAVPTNPAWPVPPGYVDAAVLNSNIRDAIRFLTYPPIFRAWLAGSGNTIPSQTFPAGSQLPLDTVTVDNYGGWSAANNHWTAPVPGLYTAYGQMSYTDTVTASHGSAVGFSVNAGTPEWHRMGYTPSSASGNQNYAAMTKLRLNAGDTVALYGFQDGGAAEALVGGTGTDQTRLVIVWESD